MSNPTPADRLALALCGAIDPATGTCATGEICRRCRRDAAAVVRELAEQVVPDEPDYMRSAIPDPGWWDKQDSVRHELLALAAELEGN